MLSAWSTDNEVCLGQIKVDDKSNEITAMPQLMELIDLRGTIITADALNTQKAIVTKVIEQGADYILPVKGNQPTLLQEVVLAFEGMEKEQLETRKRWEHSLAKAQEHRDQSRIEKLMKKGPSSFGVSIWEETEKGHGRVEQRTCTVTPVGNLPSKDDWQKLTTLVRVDRERKYENKIQTETVYYIASLKPEASLIGQTVRKHWGIENNLHLALDVALNQDKSRYRNRIGAENLAVIRKMVLNALLKETSLKKGIATKQCAAACNPEYREKILKILF